MAILEGLRTDATPRPAWEPLVVDCAGRQSLDQWARANDEWVDRMLLRHGAILFRGFGVRSTESFGSAAEALCSPLMDYVYRSTPRTTVGKHVYTATEYPAHASIPMHNEHAYARDWPMRLMLCCLSPAETGGETPLASTAGVTKRIADEVKESFARRGVMYVRNYGRGVDLTWQQTFQTDSKQDVATFCREHSIECEWLSDGHLRTRQRCQGLARHPVTNQELWFNQAHLFHVSSLDAATQSAMLDVFAEEHLPRNAYFGDGGAIDPGVLDHIRQAYVSETFTCAWESGDVMLLDNMLVSHGRRPYTGQRRVLAAMGDPVSRRSRQEAAAASGGCCVPGAR
jgi:alpha-ketoglutarate-dependent taurine dioxygenase